MERQRRESGKEREGMKHRGGPSFQEQLYSLDQG